MILLRRVIGDALRARRQSQHRTLREVSTAANVSLGYLSEIERGQKEASSELLAAICDALGAQLSELLREVTYTVANAERTDLVPVNAGGRPVPAPAASPDGAIKTTESGARAIKSSQPATRAIRPAAAATRAIKPAEGSDFNSKAPGIVLPSRTITVDGDLAVSVHQNSPLKATLRATRNGRGTKRGREVALSR